MQSKPKFKRTPRSNVYEAYLSGTLVGTVEKRESSIGPFWQGHYVGETPNEYGYEVKPEPAWTRIDATWNMINS